MTIESHEHEYRRIAERLNRGMEERDMDGVIALFDEACEIELMGIRLSGIKGVQRWLRWTYANFHHLSFSPVLTLVQEGALCQEYVLRARLDAKSRLESRQIKIITFENGKIRNVRIYFDRVDMAESLAQGFAARTLVKSLVKTSIRGLV